MLERFYPPGDSERPSSPSSSQSQESITNNKAFQLGAVAVGGILVLKEWSEGCGYLPVLPDLIPYNPMKWGEWLDVETAVQAGIGVLAAKWGLNRLFGGNRS